MSNSELIQIEVTEEVLKMNGHEWRKGDKQSFSSSDAKIICENGWGTAVNGELETGERIPGSKPIKADDVVQVV